MMMPQAERMKSKGSLPKGILKKFPEMSDSSWNLPREKAEKFFSKNAFLEAA